MIRARLAALLLPAAPAATAWVPCDDASLKAPVPLQREAAQYPQAVRGWQGPARRRPPRVTEHAEPGVCRAGSWAALSPNRDQPLP
jgi:hypothetical protein